MSEDKVASINDHFDFVSYTSMASLATGSARRWMIIEKDTRKVVDEGIKSLAGAINRAKKLLREQGENNE